LAHAAALEACAAIIVVVVGVSEKVGDPLLAAEICQIGCGVFWLLRVIEEGLVFVAYRAGLLEEFRSLRQGIMPQQVHGTVGGNPFTCKIDRTFRLGFGICARILKAFVGMVSRKRLICQKCRPAKDTDNYDDADAVSECPHAAGRFSS